MTRFYFFSTVDPMSKFHFSTCNLLGRFSKSRMLRLIMQLLAITFGPV